MINRRDWKRESNKTVLSDQQINFVLQFYYPGEITIWATYKTGGLRSLKEPEELVKTLNLWVLQAPEGLPPRVWRFLPCTSSLSCFSGLLTQSWLLGRKITFFSYICIFISYSGTFDINHNRHVFRIINNNCRENVHPESMKTVRSQTERNIV